MRNEERTLAVFLVLVYCLLLTFDCLILISVTGVFLVLVHCLVLMISFQYPLLLVFLRKWKKNVSSKCNVDTPLWRGVRIKLCIFHIQQTYNTLGVVLLYKCTKTPWVVHISTAADSLQAGQLVKYGQGVTDRWVHAAAGPAGQRARHASVDCGNEATCLLDLSLLVR